MDTIFMNSENSKTSEHHVLVLKLTDKLDLRRGQKTVALSNLSIYYTWKNVKISYNNNKFKISAPTWSEDFELPDGSYSVSDIQDFVEYILSLKLQCLNLVYVITVMHIFLLRELLVLITLLLKVLMQIILIKSNI